VAEESVWQLQGRELQGLKPTDFAEAYVVAETTTHKDFWVVTQALQQRPERLNAPAGVRHEIHRIHRFQA
jgi:hypothetical protein